MRAAVVIAFERLPLRQLGCYGCIPSPSPHIDRFAAESVVFDGHFAENIDADAAGHAWWTGRSQFPIPRAEQRRQPETLFVSLAAAGVECVGVCEPEPKASLVPRSQIVNWNETPASAGSRELFRQATDRLAGSPSRTGNDRLLWVLSTEIAAWDFAPATIEKRVRAIDESFGRLYETVRDQQRASGSETLLILTAAGGMPESVSSPDSLPNPLPEPLRPLAECAVHTPLLVRAAGGHGGLRQSSLVQTADLVPTLLEWFGISTEGVACDGRSLLPLLREDVPTGGRDAVCFGDGPHCCGIRTRDFCLMSPRVAEETCAELELGNSTVDPPGVRLFVKPDDPWEVHNVAEQEPETVARLLERLREFVARRATGSE
jgi:arylsulfatase A-like enzyme